MLKFFKIILFEHGTMALKIHYISANQFFGGNKIMLHFEVRLKGFGCINIDVYYKLMS